MCRKRISWVVFITLILSLSLALTLSLDAATTALELDGVVIPLGTRQADVRSAYARPLADLYAGHRLYWSATGETISRPVLLGDLYFPPGEGRVADSSYTTYQLSDTLPLSRAFVLHPRRIAVLRSTATFPIGEGHATVMWELGDIRQTLEGYLRKSVPYTILTEDAIAARMSDYDLLIIPAFNPDYRDAVLTLLQDADALTAIHDFVQNGGTLYAQSSGLWIAEQAGLLDEGTVDLDNPIQLPPEDSILDHGELAVRMPDSPLAYSWLTHSLYIANDPLIVPGETLDVIADLTNTADGMPVPAIVRVPVGDGQVIGIVGHPTKANRREQVPLFMDALLTALAGRVAFYGDAIQTWHLDYDAHTFPAYEIVPISTTLHVENLWDEVQHAARVVETVSPGYHVLTASLTSEYTTTFSALPDGRTVITWTLGDLAPNAHIVLSYRAESDPTALAGGRGTFSNGTLTYDDHSSHTAYLPTPGKPTTVVHPPFILDAKMAARLVGDRDIEGDRYFLIPGRGIYLDVATPLENKEETAAYTLQMRDWAYLLVPIVDIENQHIILNANDGETIWLKNEPFLWDERKGYPAWEGATSPTQTLTLDDWRALPESERPRCVFTSTYGIHIDPPWQARAAITDYGSFINIPPTYTDAITVINNELWLPCLPLDWDLGNVPGYWYEEPAVRFGIHSRELFERDVYFHGTPREDAVVMPYDAGSIYVLAGDFTVPYREHLPHAVPYAAQAPADSDLTYMDVWSRTHTLTFRSSFYDVWAWDSCRTCGGPFEQHAGFAVTFGIWADLDGDGEHETFVREIPTRLDDAPSRNGVQLQLLGKTYSRGDSHLTIPADENLIDLPIFHGLGIQIGPEGATWYDSWRSIGPGTSDLFSVTEGIDYDNLYFRQVIPDGSWASFVVSATIENYPFNREGPFKLHDGGRLVYRQQIAGPNRYEVYDAHPHVPEGWRSDGVISKRGGPLQVSMYDDTVMFINTIWDEADARTFASEFDPFIKSWGYGDLVWTTYVGGREDKTIFSTLMGMGDRAIVRVALDNNTGVTLTNLSVSLGEVAGINSTHIYTDPDTAPEPIWPELAFLNRSEVPDAWRSVWYFEIEVGDDVPTDLWGQVIEIPVIATADNFPMGKAYAEVPAARIALQRPGDAAPTYISGLAHGLVFTDVILPNVELVAAAYTTDKTVVDALDLALDVDAGVFSQDTASLLYASLVPTQATPLTYTVDVNGLVTFTLPAEVQDMPLADTPLYIIVVTNLVRAHHGPNVVNAGAGIRYTDPFGMQWTAQSAPVIVEASGASVWVEYDCDSGGPPERMSEGGGDEGGVYAVNGTCYLPYGVPADVDMLITGYNEGDGAANYVTFTLNLPSWVTVTASTPKWHSRDGQDIVWTVGDLAPGQRKYINATFHIEPVTGDAGRARQAALPVRDLKGINHTHGDFIEVQTHTPVSGRVGDAFWFKVYTPERAASLIYLPIVMRGYQSPVTIPVQVGVPFDIREPLYQGEVFYTATLQLPRELRTDGTYYLSAQLDAVVPIRVDDELALVVNGEDVFTYRFSAPGDPPGEPVSATVALPASVIPQIDGQAVVFEYRDVYGAYVEATDVWLIWRP